MSVADLEAIYQAAQAALAAGDYAEAIRQALICKMRLATTANVARLGNSMAWGNAQSLDNFIAECRKSQDEANVATIHGRDLFQQTKVVYQRPDCY
jgi:hypothetical protein